jgi:hypothetical protein
MVGGGLAIATVGGINGCCNRRSGVWGPFWLTHGWPVTVVAVLS